jgi:hypothetical protein
VHISAVPLVLLSTTDPLVGQVRKALNVPGDNTLDRGLAEIIRGVQRSNNLAPHGELDEQTLGLFGITAY